MPQENKLSGQLEKMCKNYFRNQQKTEVDRSADKSNQHLDNTEKDRPPLTVIDLLDNGLHDYKDKSFYKASIKENTRRFIPFTETYQWLKTKI